MVETSFDVLVYPFWVKNAQGPQAVNACATWTENTPHPSRQVVTPSPHGRGLIFFKAGAPTLSPRQRELIFWGRRMRHG